jgi:hypothetical protein
MAHILETRPTKIVVKPLDGQGGRGVTIFHGTASSYTTKSGQVLTDAALAARAQAESFIVQVGIEQHEELARIYPNSVNTIRVTTENREGAVRIATTSMRFGNEGSEVDNISQQGINVRVEPESGRLDACGFNKRGQLFKAHPDSGVPFEQCLIPGWAQVREDILRFASKLPQLAYLGWDVALTRNETLVIEVNFGFGIDAQNIHRGMRRPLRIADPQLYWRTRGVR